MKKLVILFIATIVSGGLYAAAIDAPTSPSNVLVERDSDGIGVFKNYRTDSSGNPIAVSATVNVWPASVSYTAYTLTSATARTMNVTTVAGTSGSCMVCISAYGGAGAGIVWAKTNSATPPTCMDGINAPCGGYTAVIAGEKCRAASPGDYFHTISHSVGDVSVFEEVELLQ